ncbi:MAG: 6-bladed beta-propeller [Candidatus Aminicenantes bacterium]|nr:6-bladed beta-propeller [Candidatus Aminicenantes bacterium]
MRRIITVGLSLLLVFVLSGPITAQKTKTEEGIKIISNGSKPKPQKGVPSKVTLTEELRFGEGDDPEKSFSQVAFFVVTDEGHVVATDIKDRKVKVFDAEGNFLRNIGKSGQGPGEFQIPGGLVLTPNNDLLIEDSMGRRLVFFTLEGEFIKNVSVADKMGLLNLVLDADGNYLGRQLGLEGQKMYFEMKKYDKDLNPVFTMDKVEFDIPVPGSGVKIDMMDMVTVYLFDSAGNVFYGRNRDYEIKVFKPDGTHIRSIRKDFKPVKVTHEDIDMLSERVPTGIMRGIDPNDFFEFPKEFPPFQAFILDEQDRLFVRTWIKGKEKGAYIVDVFDAEGRFISQFETKLDIRVCKGDKIYGVEDNEDGFLLVKRYRISWGN